MIFDFKLLYKDLIANEFIEWQETLPAQLKQILKEREHGKTAEWEKYLAELPDLKASQLILNTDKVTAGLESDCSFEEKTQLETHLKQLHPWRKGPYDLFGLHLKTEWRSDWKWQRIQPHIAPLKNRSVLDVGCGNGYHMWRMLGEGARLVIGVDPSQFFLVQFHTIKHFASVLNGDLPIHILPLKGEELPPFTQAYKGLGFDTVFSMGVLYHRLSPIDHLKELRTFIRSGGELVLETLIIEGDDSNVLIPEDRYAKMRNVWFIPTPALLVRMLERAGFVNIRVVDINQTSIEEQQSTDWMTFESLPDFLDPNDHNKTIEGYSAPKRAVLICNTA
ncbi:MAG: tRNA 5-methoxyuridine(34)/uridine 5-oxyacetic acid(34) synthase CmoB [Cocleimonas sp.]